jgi:hypothetical protein
MSQIKYKEGDLFDALDQLADGVTIAVPHVCNNVGAWGSGFVVPLGQRFPLARDCYKKWHVGTLPGNAVYLGGSAFTLGNTQVVEVMREAEKRVFVFNMIAQRGVGGARPLRYHFLARCMMQLAQVFEKYQNPQIYAPLFGAGLAGGNWDFIVELIKDCWLDNGFPVTIYYLKDRLPVGWSPPSEGHVS